MSFISKIVTVLLIFISLEAHNHPSWGIVVDNTGVVYFVEPMHNGGGTLWRFDPKTKKITALQKRFHAHSLTIDDKGEIHTAIAIWRTGEIEGEGHNYLFKYNSQINTLDTLLFTDDWDTFFGGNFEITPDKQKVYFPMGKRLNELDLKTNKTIPLDHYFPRFCTMAFDKNETLWITDSNHKEGTLFKWNNNDGFKEVTTNFFPKNRSNAIFKEINHQIFYGIGFSENGDPLLTENVENSIWQIFEDGEKSRCYTSDPSLYPTGVYYKDEKYYVMEFGYTTQNNGPRLVILDKNFNLKELFEFDFD